MKLQEIEQAITELNPKDLTRFRRWFEKFEKDAKAGGQIPVTREYVHSFRGKYKGKGLMKALLAGKE